MSCSACHMAPEDGKVCRFCGERRMTNYERRMLAAHEAKPVDELARLRSDLERARGVLRRCSALKCHRDNDPRKETLDCGTCPPCASRAFLAATPETAPPTKETP